MCQDMPGQGRAAPPVPMARGWFQGGTLHLGWWDPTIYPTLCPPTPVWDWGHWGHRGAGLSPQRAWAWLCFRIWVPDCGVWDVDTGLVLPLLPGAIPSSLRGLKGLRAGPRAAKKNPKKPQRIPMPGATPPLSLPV